MPYNNPYGGIDNPYGSQYDMHDEAPYSAEVYDQPNLYNLMADYMLGADQDMPTTGQFTKGVAGGMGMTEESWDFLQMFTSMIPTYGETTGAFKEKASRQQMIHQIYEAGARQSKKVRQAKADSLGQHAQYGKMGFRSGESGQTSQYINDSVLNSNVSESASAMGARYDLGAKKREIRTDFVDSLWELYGDFLASGPERVGGE